MNRVRRAVPVFCLGVMLVLPTNLFTCGPFFEKTVFAYSVHPDLPLDPFAAGKLGVLRPTYARSYLYVAYRYLQGQEFTAVERKSLVALWEARLKSNLWPRENDELETWKKVRAKVPGIPALPDLSEYARTGAYGYFLNCTPDAFRTAAATLQKRMREFGAPTAEVREWVQAQDQVFSNCSLQKPSIPGSTVQAASALLRADRKYQIAAAEFYAAHFENAVHLFDEIAADRTSPWSQVAPYLAARSVLRKATLRAPESEPFVKADLLQAEARLNRIIGDKQRVSLHRPARRLLDFVGARLHLSEQLLRLSRRLMQPQNSNLAQNLADYTILLDGYLGEGLPWDRWSDPPQKTNRDIEPLRRQDDLIDWLTAFQRTGTPDGSDHAIRKWRETAGPHWLLAALSKINSSHKSATELTEAAMRVASDSPAYLTAQFLALRLMVESGQAEKARTQIDEVFKISELPTSARNDFLMLRSAAAGSLDDLLAHAPRMPVLETIDDNGGEVPEEWIYYERGRERKKTPRVAFDRDGANILNRLLPLDTIALASREQSLPEHLRREISVATWTRAVLLGRHEAARELAPQVQALAPEMSKSLAAYLSAASDEERQFTGLVTLLRFPGLRPYVVPGRGRATPLPKIDDYRENWWCHLQTLSNYQPNFFKNYNDQPDTESIAAWNPGLRVDEELPTIPAFLRSDQRTQAAKEWQQLMQTGNAPNHFVRQVLRWTRQHPQDARNPEALHLAVRATRFGCTDLGTSALSREAFNVLHAKYPRSRWASKTRYWY